MKVLWLIFFFFPWWVGDALKVKCEEELDCLQMIGIFADQWQSEQDWKHKGGIEIEGHFPLDFAVPYVSLGVGKEFSYLGARVGVLARGGAIKQCIVGHGRSRGSCARPPNTTWVMLPVEGGLQRFWSFPGEKLGLGARGTGLSIPSGPALGQGVTILTWILCDSSWRKSTLRRQMYFKGRADLWKCWRVIKGCN